MLKRSQKPMKRTRLDSSKPRTRIARKPVRVDVVLRRRLRYKPDPKMAAWGKKVLERDGNQCQWPGGCFTGNRQIDPHHITERSLRPDLKYQLSNGKALCREHHNWLPLHREEAIRMGLLSDETYELAAK